MKKVYQEIIKSQIGDCLRACVASLLELPIDGVPNFQRLHFRKHINWFHSYWYYLRWFKYEVTYSADVENALSENEGMNGLFIASVPSQKFKNRYHAVIVNKLGEVVHDLILVISLHTAK